MKLWDEGKNVKEIISILNCDKSVVQTTLTNANIPITEKIKRGQDTTEKEKIEEEIIKLWNENKAVYEICNEL